MNDVAFLFENIFPIVMIGLLPITMGIMFVVWIVNAMNRAFKRPESSDHSGLNVTYYTTRPEPTSNVETQNLASLHPTTPTTTPRWMQAISFVVALYRIVTRPRQCPNCGSVLHNGVCAYCGFEH